MVSEVEMVAEGKDASILLNWFVFASDTPHVVLALRQYS